MNIKNILIASVLIVLLAGCSNQRQFVQPNSLQDDRNNIKEPQVRNYNWVSDHFDMQFTMQVEQSFDLSRQLRNVFNKPKQAYNVNAFDEVENSSWFTNRNAQQLMSIEEICKGPDAGTGPDMSDKWIITRAKSEGVTPGFHIKDKKGDRYVIKFDPIGYSELVTGAEVVSTKLFYAAGYHVPENYIVHFHPDILCLGENVKFTDVKGRNRFMNKDDLEEILNRVEKQPDGSIRALASKYIPGIPKGPFDYRGTRKDDPNDIIPHQHRRELRGLKVISAWLNHVDTKSGNSFDSYISNDGKNYIRHYLIDFGTTLGSGAKGPMEPLSGHINQIDPHEIALNTMSLGLYVHDYEKFQNSQFPSVGLWEAGHFKPDKFKFYTPNPAFENCTNRDGFWGAKIVTSFSDEQLEAIVNLGQYSNPEAEKYILEVLKKRRDKTGRYWFNKINPLDNFKLVEISDNHSTLLFDDLAVSRQYEDAENSFYKYHIRLNGQLIADERKNKDTSIELDQIQKEKFTEILSKNDSSSNLVEIEIMTFRESRKNSNKAVYVYLNLDSKSGKYSLLGISRQE